MADPIKVKPLVPADMPYPATVGEGPEELRRKGFVSASNALRYVQQSLDLIHRALRKAGELASDVIGAIQQEAYTYAADTGAADAYVVALSPKPTLKAGSVVVFKAANGNTGASTLAVNSGSPIAITKQGATALASGDIAAGQIVRVVFDGTSWQMTAGGSGSGVPGPPGPPGGSDWVDEPLIGTVDGANKVFHTTWIPVISSRTGNPIIQIQRNHSMLDMFVDQATIVPARQRTYTDINGQFGCTDNVVIFEVAPAPGDRLVAHYLPGALPTLRTTAGLCALVGAFTDAAGAVILPIYFGNGPKTLTVPFGATQLQLGLNDDNFGDNDGSFLVTVNGVEYTVTGARRPWMFTGGINAVLPFGNGSGAAPVVISGLTPGASVAVAYVSGTIRASGSRPYTDANGDGTTATNTGSSGTYFPAHYMAP
jgi:hypothetical protein